MLTHTHTHIDVRVARHVGDEVCFSLLMDYGFVSVCVHVCVYVLTFDAVEFPMCVSVYVTATRLQPNVPGWDCAGQRARLFVWRHACTCMHVLFSCCPTPEFSHQNFDVGPTGGPELYEWTHIMQNRMAHNFNNSQAHTHTLCLLHVNVQNKVF